MKVYFFLPAWVYVVPLLGSVAAVQASLTLGDGTSLRLQSDTELNLHCQPINIQTNAALKISEVGVVRQVSTFTLAGVLDGGAGRIEQLASWVNNGHIQSLPALNFTADCGPMQVAGTSDTDGDGVSDSEEALQDTNADRQPDFLDAQVQPLLALQLYAVLQGALEAETGLMRDDLRRLKLLPLQQPYAEQFAYAGTETLNPRY